MVRRNEMKEIGITALWTLAALIVWNLIRPFGRGSAIPATANPGTGNFWE
jgi:hypothetical protein